MYLSGGSATINGLLSPTGNYVIWSAHLGPPVYTEWNQAEQMEIKSYYVITRETLALVAIVMKMLERSSSFILILS